MACSLRKMSLAALVFAVLTPSVQGQQAFPDLILMNGRVFTSDLLHPYVEALAIRGDRVVAAGTSGKIATLAGPQTKRIDLGGRVVIPGINDAHYHCDVEPRHFQFDSRAWIPPGQK